MPQWLVVVGIALAWVLAIVAIVVFMMGASRSRRKESEHEKALAQQLLAKKDR
ncbi:hypothetical protein [Arthrobacter sp. HY1533]|uniref:hypothetical protein n=1 Tax=Arthrobacter sp. HY1533 TaxID=2970919 RepID=UPI0022B9D77D|nr:hypothetical protein [Arthrobacter sp. HY1533]